MKLGKRWPIVFAAMLAPFVVPLYFDAMMGWTPIITAPLGTDLFELGIAYIATIFFGVPCYVLMRGRGVTAWLISGMIGLGAAALLPVWLMVGAYIFTGGSFRPSTSNMREMIDYLKWPGPLLYAGPGILTGLIFHAVVLLCERLSRPTKDKVVIPFV
jgi:hypothetical protein